MHFYYDGKKMEITKRPQKFLPIMVPISDGYQEFCQQLGLPDRDCMELLAEDFLDDYQRLVVTKFYELFEAIEQAESAI